MARHASGIFTRNDRVRVASGTTVRVLCADRKPAVRALLVALSATDLVITCAQPLVLGTRLAIALTLPGRYIEFELPGAVEWENGSSYGIAFGYLSARQAYGVALAREVLREREAPSSASLQRARG
jgi:hypothetical protein